jgi:hypothetical protein
MGAIDDPRIAHAAGVTETDESLLPAASVEPPSKEPCLTRRGRVELRPDGIFLHFCVECGADGQKGHAARGKHDEGDALRRGQRFAKAQKCDTAAVMAKRDIY